MASRTRSAREVHRDEDLPEKKIRFVLSERAVRRLRTADQILHDLWEKTTQQCPAWLANEVAHAYLSVTEAVNEIEQSNVEAAP